MEASNYNDHVSGTFALASGGSTAGGIGTVGGMGSDRGCSGNLHEKNLVQVSGYHA